MTPSVRPDEDGVCRLCAGPTKIDEYGFRYPSCYPCFQWYRDWLDGLVPICYSLHEQLESAIYRAKHHEPWLRAPLASLLWEFLVRHWDCIQRQYGDIATCTVVPSHASARNGVDHLKALHRVIKGWPQPWDLDLLVKTRADKATDRRQKVDPDLFRVADDRSVSGTSVLLLDDTFTSGGTLVSAAAALKQGGATSVVGLTLGRQLNREYPESRDFIGMVEGRELDLEVCVLHDRPGPSLFASLW